MAITAPITSNIVDKSRIAGDFLLEMPVYISTLVLTKIGPQPDWTVIYVSGRLYEEDSIGETHQRRSVGPLERMYQIAVGFYFQQK